VAPGRRPAAAEKALGLDAVALAGHALLETLDILLVARLQALHSRRVRRARRVRARRAQVVIVDELAHTNAPGSTHQKRFEDVLDILTAGIDVISAVNIQHIESLNDVIASTTGVRVRETIPDWVLKRADEVVNVDVSIETLRDRLRQGKIYDTQKIEQALSNFFRKGNLTALRELALRQLATDQAGKAQEYRSREGLERSVIPEKVMVAIASRGSARTLLRVGSRIAGRLASDWFAVYVETPKEEPGRMEPTSHVALEDNIRTYLARQSAQGEAKHTIHGNQIRVRLVKGGSRQTTKVIGFVHNPDSDPDVLFDITLSLIERIGAKARTGAPARSADDRWLVLAGDDRFSYIEPYRHVYSQLSIPTGFKKILVVLADGRIETMTG